MDTQKTEPSKHIRTKAQMDEFTDTLQQAHIGTEQIWAK